MSPTKQPSDRWQAILARSADLLLPTDLPRTSTTDTDTATPHRHTTHTVTLQYTDTLITAIEALVKQTKSSYNHVLLTAITILLHRWCSDESFNIALNTASQPLLITTEVTPTDTYATLSNTLNKVYNDAVKYAMSYDELDLLRTDAIGPLYRIVVAYADTTSPSPVNDTTADNNTDAALHDTATQTNGYSKYPSHVDMVFSVTPSSTSIQYNSQLFHPQRVQCYIEQLTALLTTAATTPDLTITNIPLIQPGGGQTRVLPDPTSDLHWNQWFGAVHQVFSTNARRHPDRTCIVESTRDAKSNEHKPRVYTYRQIHHASNMLAHYLLQSGLQQESVVTVYAARTAELVIAFMSVLKAGGVISVIDPAYPTHRQIVYLQVAQPKALIVMSQAGALAADVMEYVDNHLDLQCMIPALSIDTDGVLYANKDQSDDPLQSVRSQADKDPDVVIGPDSWGTLSFTSGTTGLPKGVQGRHFSLTHYYTWMSQHFGLGENDRFTMLSGIAHDPIQRDIFTPLYMSATLYIPHQSDILSPGKLAVWCNSNQITVTHLTPAMGQLLSTHATTQIGTLRRAFFVGDILTKRDTLKLCKLAPNLELINMYGTTETQRAVSYYTVPSYNSYIQAGQTDIPYLGTEKDIIPAGKGMNNVQLLVVNRYDKTQVCGVGEVGEIYVRAGGLAEGYLRLLDATKEKFWPNWFVGDSLDDKMQLDQSVLQTEWDARTAKYWRGKRDRLYRTGDLGRYRADGLVECSGRADDQVKIRGFRVELGEIDTYLSQHQHIRENVTVVRKDKQTNEPFIVSFIVLNNMHDHSDDENDTQSDAVQQPGVVNWYSTHRCRSTCKQINSYLTTKLPVYALPTQYVILRFMPLTPNGKADKAVLQIPDQMYYLSTRAQYKHIPSKSDKKKQTGGEQSTPRLDELTALLSLTTTGQRVYMLYVKLLPNASQPLPTNVSFFDLGGHSILATQLLYETNKLFDISLNPTVLFSDVEPSVLNLARAIEDELNTAVKPNGVHHDSEEKRQESDTVAVKSKHSTAYADDVSVLAQQLAQKYTAAQSSNKSSRTVFLTGVTGFLGNFILQRLLQADKTTKVVCLVRGASDKQAYSRMKSVAVKHCVWSDEFAERITVVAGDLSEPHFGLTDDNFVRLGKSIDVVIHNGATVHWLYSYAKLRAVNVLSTLTCIQLASVDVDNAKPVVFVSSTAVLGDAYYTTLASVSESDDLTHSRTTLTDGYGQTKYVSEQLVQLVRQRGLPATTVRPAYILGHSITGVTNTDDFVWRLAKWCVQSKTWPAEVDQLLSAVSVDQVSDIIVRATNAACNGTSAPVYHTAQLDGKSAQWSTLHNVLQQSGYTVRSIPYADWCKQLQLHIAQLGVDEIGASAIYPIHHILLENLPAFCKSAALSGTNTAKLYPDAAPQSDTADVLLRNVAFLEYIRYLDKPTGKASVPLPQLPTDLLKHATLLSRASA